MSPDNPWHWLYERFPDPWERVREGFLQLAVGSLLRSEARDQVDDALQQEIDETVLEPFLSIEWLPGVKDAAAKIADDARENDLDVMGMVECVASYFLQRLPQRPSDEDVERTLQHSLEEAVNQEWVVADEEAPQRLKKDPRDAWQGPPSPHWQKAWAAQALALRHWQALEPVVLGAICGYLEDEWRKECSAFVQQIERRNEVGTWAPWRWLVQAQSRGDYDLFAEAGQLLTRARQRIDPREVRGETPSVLGRALPEEWPPVLLFRCTSVEVLEKLQEVAFLAPRETNDFGGFARKTLGEAVQKEWAERTKDLLKGGSQTAVQKHQPPKIGAQLPPAAKEPPRVPEPKRTPEEEAKARVKALLQQGRQHDPQWTHWKECSPSVEDLLAGSETTNALSLLSWFQGFYDRHGECPETSRAKGVYGDLCLHLRERLRAAKLPLVWPVEQWQLNDRLEVKALDYTVDWIVDAKITEGTPGSVLRVKAFGDHQTPPRLVVNLGKPAHPRLRAWLKTPVGRKWFDVVCKGARSNPDKLSGQALRQLVEEQWCQSYPALDLDQKPAALYWPGEVPFSRATIRVIPRQVPHPSNPALGLAVEETEDLTFTPEVDEARCVVVLSDDWPGVEYAEAVYQVCAEGGRLGKSLDGLFQEWLKVWASPEAKGGNPTWVAEQVPQVIEPLLQALEANAQGKGERERLGRVLAGMQGCLSCTPWKLALTPVTLEWVGQTWEDIPDPKWCQPIPVASSSAEWGRVLGLAHFGLERPGEGMLRQASVRVGVGGSPPAMHALAQLLDTVSWSTTESLRQQLEVFVAGWLRGEQPFLDGLYPFYREYHKARLAELPQDLDARIGVALGEILRALSITEYQPREKMLDYGRSCDSEVEVEGSRSPRAELKQVIWPGLRKDDLEHPILVKAKARYE